MRISIIQTIIDVVRGKKQLGLDPLKQHGKILKFMFEKQNSIDEFVEFSDQPFVRTEKDVKLIAFYLPQYNKFAENDMWHGKGFTEWSMTTKAIPQFVGHNQPQLPYDVGFYDLAHDDVMFRQIELARHYGIYGFCFHYYWFSGKRLMEKPIFNWLKNKKLDFPFCLCWASENWSKLWDGGNRELLMEQKLENGDDEKFLQDILPFFQDERYIKIDNKPLLIIYNIHCFEKQKITDFIAYLRKEIVKYGFDGIYILSSAASLGDHQMTIPKLIEIGFDQVVEFPPHPFFYNKKIFPEIPNKNFKGVIVDTADFIKHKKYHTEAKFKCVFPSWDNSARKAYTGCYIYQLKAEEFREWLTDCILETKRNNKSEEQLVFINAWNEWGEGAHLEPDTRFGYQNLSIVRKCLESTK